MVTPERQSSYARQQAAIHERADRFEEAVRAAARCLAPGGGADDRRIAIAARAWLRNEEFERELAAAAKGAPPSELVRLEVLAIVAEAPQTPLKIARDLRWSGKGWTEQRVMRAVDVLLERLEAEGHVRIHKLPPPAPGRRSQVFVEPTVRVLEDLEVDLFSTGDPGAWQELPLEEEPAYHVVREADGVQAGGRREERPAAPAAPTPAVEDLADEDDQEEHRGREVSRERSSDRALPPALAAPPPRKEESECNVPDEIEHDPRSCASCEVEFTPRGGWQQAKRAYCYECRPSVAAKGKAKKRRREPEPDELEDEDLEEEDLDELEEEDLEDERPDPVTRVRRRAVRVLGFLRRGLRALEERLEVEA